jgi:transcriptional regulator with XRE-family HTH domain
MANDNVELLRLGHRIQAERKILGFSQNDFAKDCGLNRSFFGGIERGERNLTFAILCKICNGLHCDIASVTKGDSAGVLTFAAFFEQLVRGSSRHATACRRL